MVREDRYLGSDDGLKMQQQAAASVAENTKQAIDKTSEGVQQYLSGVVQSSQRLVELQQTKAAIDANRQPSAFAEFASNAVNAAFNWKKQEAQEQQQALEAAKLAKREQEAIDKEKAKGFAEQRERFVGQLQAGRAKDYLTQVTNVEQEIDQLTAIVESENWKDGESYYRTQASRLLGKLEPTTAEEVKEVLRLTKKVSDTVIARGRNVGGKLAEDLERQQNFNADKAKFNLMMDIHSQASYIRAAGLSDSDGLGRLNWIVDRINSWTNDDSTGIPYTQRLRISAEVLRETQESYFKKVDLNTTQAARLREFDQWVKLQNAIGLKQDSGQLSPEQADIERARLDQRYPEFSRYHVRPGDREAINLRLLQIDQQTREIIEKRGKAAADQVTYDPEVIRSIAAAGYLDSIFFDRDLKNSPLKDNRNIQAAISYVQRLKEAEGDSLTLQLNLQEKNSQILRQNLSSVEAYLETQRRLASSKSPADKGLEQFVTSTGQQVRTGNPQLDAIMVILENQRNSGTQLDPRILQQANDLWAGEIRKVTDSLQNEQNILRSNFVQKYGDLINLGLLTPNGVIDKGKLQSQSRLGVTALEALQNRVNQTQLEVQQQFTPQYGLTPGFNPSSAFVPVTDDKGRLALPPRKQVEIQDIDGQRIAIPVVAGSKAFTTSPGQRFGAPRAYRNGIHQGLDFNLGRGGKAVSMVSGTVVFTTASKGGYGGVVDILGDNGVVYRYAHQLPLVKPGQRVYPGQAVSQSNGSGVNIGGDHLHFEVKLNPKFNGTKYDSNGGQPVDPLSHLKKLNAGSSDLLTPRVNQSLFRAFPSLKAPANSTLLSNGGVLNANVYQRVGSAPQESRQVFSGQRPAKLGATPAYAKVGSVQYDVNDDMGYAELRKDNNLRKAIVQTAKNLGVPAEWIADIARQESGLNPYRDHMKENPRANPNGNYGLFGFGSDSFHDKSIHSRLRAGKIDAIGQLALYEKYIRENGWDKVIKQKNGQVTVADLWALTKFGTKARWNVINTGNLAIKSFPGTSLTYMDELKLLGKWVGRRYEFNNKQSRVNRNSPVSEQPSAYCPVCAQLQASAAFVPHAHQLEGFA